MTTSHGKLLFLYKERLQSIARHQLERGRLGDEVTLIFDHFIRVVDRIFGGSFDSSANAETRNFTNILVIDWRSTSVRTKSLFLKSNFENIFCFCSFYNSLEDLKSLENDDEYDYKWDRYDGSWDNVVEYPSPRYQKRSYHGQVDAFKRAKAAREWYTRLG